MSKIDIQNDLPTSVTVKYKSIDDANISQTIGGNSTKQTEKKVKPNTSVIITISQQSKSITYESVYRTLRVVQNHQSFNLQWI